MDLPHKVCCHHRNRNARFCPQLVDNAWLDGNLQDTVFPTGVLLTILVHWVSIKKNEGKDLRLSAKQFAICSIPFICDWYLAIQESDGCFQKMHQYQYYLIPQPYLPQT